MDTQLEVMLEAQRLVLQNTARQLAAYQRTVLKLIRLLGDTNVPVADIQAALAEVGERQKDAATLVAEAVEGARLGNA